jgi:hypothetical protein
LLLAARGCGCRFGGGQSPALLSAFPALSVNDFVFVAYGRTRPLNMVIIGLLIRKKAYWKEVDLSAIRVLA